MVSHGIIGMVWKFCNPKWVTARFIIIIVASISVAHDLRSVHVKFDDTFSRRLAGARWQNFKLVLLSTCAINRREKAWLADHISWPRLRPEQTFICKNIIIVKKNKNVDATAKGGKPFAHIWTPLHWCIKDNGTNIQWIHDTAGQYKYQTMISLINTSGTTRCLKHLIHFCVWLISDKILIVLENTGRHFARHNFLWFPWAF